MPVASFGDEDKHVAFACQRRRADSEDNRRGHVDDKAVDTNDVAIEKPIPLVHDL